MKSNCFIRLAGAAIGIVAVLFLFFGNSGAASASAILPGYDLLTTPPGGGVLDLSGVGGPAAFPLVGRPIGPSNTDTIVQRFGTLPPGGTGIIPSQLVALSLESVAPVFLPGPSSFFDVFVDLDPSFTSPGQINVTSHIEPTGGTFDSIFTVNSRVTFTQVGNPLNQFQVFRTDNISSTGSPWSHFATPGYPIVPAYPHGNFFPGAIGGAPGVESQNVGLTHTGPHPHTNLAFNSDVVRIYDPTLDPPNASKDFVMPEPAAGGGEPFLAAFYGPIPAPNQWVLFLEPDGSQSDRLSIRNGFLYFESDPLAQLFPDLPPVPNAVITENGLFQRVDQFFLPMPGSGYIFPRIDVFSDLDVPNVPEPGSVLLLIVGGVVTSFVGRIRRV